MAQHAQRIAGSPEYVSGEIIFADPSAKQSRLDMEELYHVDTYPAINAIEDGIDMVRNHLETYIDFDDGGKEKSYLYVVDGSYDGPPDLIATQSEFAIYRYPKGMDGKPVRRKPIMIDDHGMDCVRYIVQSSYRMIMEIAIPPTEYIEQDGYWYAQ